MIRLIVFLWNKRSTDSQCTLFFSSVVGERPQWEISSPDLDPGDLAHPKLPHWREFGNNRRHYRNNGLGTVSLSKANKSINRGFYRQAIICIEVMLMGRRFVVVVAMLAVALSMRPAVAQEPRGQVTPHPQKTSARTWGEQCSTNDKTDAAERSALEAYSSPALEEALLSSKSFWDFITDPSTPYLDRMAAANRGGSMLSPQELPLLWQAMAEVSSVPSGVKPPPCSAVAGVSLPLTLNTPRKETYRVILGRKIKLPTEFIGFPITAEERAHSPWLWQMEKALSALFDRTNRYYGNASRYPSRVKAAWDWPTPAPTDHPGEIDRDSRRAEWNTIYLRSRALTESAPHDTLLLQTILKLALNNDTYDVAYSGHVQDLYAWGNDSYRYEELAHVAQIAVLQKTRWENVASETAFVMASLATQKDHPYGSNLKPLKTATGILAIGRGLWTRA